MDNTLTTLEKRSRRAGIIMIFSLIVTAITLTIPHPLSFITFFVFGLALMAAGMIYYLVSLLIRDQKLSKAE